MLCYILLGCYYVVLNLYHSQFLFDVNQPFSIFLILNRFIPYLTPNVFSIVCLWWITSFPAFTTKFFISCFLIAAKQFVFFILSHSSLVTLEFSCICCYSSFQFFSYRFKSFGVDAILPSEFIFSSMFDVLPSTFKPILNLTQIFLESCNIIFNSPFSVRYFKFFFVGSNTYFSAY